MHILIALCISVLVAWAFKARNKPDPLGHFRLLAAGVGCLWPYLDRLLGFIFGSDFIVLYQGTFMWSVLLAPLVAWALALAFSYVLKGYEPESPYVCRRFFVPIMAGLGLTIALGIFSEEGIAILAPFWFGRVSFSVLDSFDIGLFVTLVVLLLLAAAVGRWRTDAARGILILLFLYIAVVGTFKLKAVQVGKAYAATMGVNTTAIYTLPQTLSPFYWQIIVLTDDGRLHSTKVSLKRANPLVITPETNAIRRAKAAYMPVHKAIWRIYNRFGRRNVEFAQNAWQAGFSKAALRWQGRFAVFQKKAPYKNQHCAWFKDLRFKEAQAYEGLYAICQKPLENQAEAQLEAQSTANENQKQSWRVYQAAEDGSFLLLATMY